MLLLTAAITMQPTRPLFLADGSHQLQARLLADKIAKFVASEVSFGKQRLRNPFDLLTMALDDLLRPGELPGKDLVDADLQVAVEPQPICDRYATKFNNTAVAHIDVLKERTVFGERGEGCPD